MMHYPHRVAFLVVLAATSSCSIGCPRPLSCPKSSGECDELVLLGSIWNSPALMEDLRRSMRTFNVSPHLLGGPIATGVWVRTSELSSARTVWLGLHERYPQQVESSPR